MWSSYWKLVSNISIEKFQINSGLITRLWHKNGEKIDYCDIGDIVNHISIAKSMKLLVDSPKLARFLQMISVSTWKCTIYISQTCVAFANIHFHSKWNRCVSKQVMFEPVELVRYEHKLPIELRIFACLELCVSFEMEMRAHATIFSHSEFSQL